MKQTVILNLFGPSKSVIFAGEYIAERLKSLHFDIQHCYDVPYTDKNFSRNDKTILYRLYDQTLEWMLDYNGLVDVIVNECPLAKYAYYGKKCFNEDIKKNIINSTKTFNNFNVVIFSNDLINDKSEEERILSFMQENGINGLIITKTIAHLDQVVKDIEDKISASIYNEGDTTND